MSGNLRALVGLLSGETPMPAPAWLSSWLSTEQPPVPEAPPRAAPAEVRSPAPTMAELQAMLRSLPAQPAAPPLRFRSGDEPLPVDVPELTGVRYEGGPRVGTPEWQAEQDARSRDYVSGNANAKMVGRVRSPEELQQGVQDLWASPAGRLLKSPITGAQRVAQGIERLPFQAPMEGVAMEEQPASAWNPRELAGGTADILAGGMEAGALAVPYGLARAPLQVAAGLATGTAAHEGVQAAGQRLGVAPEYTDLAANLAAIGAGVGGGKLAEVPRVRQSLLEGLSNPGMTIKPVGGPPPPRRTLLGPKAAEGEVEYGGVAEMAAQLFPRLDKYAKPTGRLTGKTILERVEAADPGLTPETKAALIKVAEQVGERRVSADEVQTLARGEAYTPARILRTPRVLKEGEKQTPGAPLGVANARDARTLREGYLDSMERGAKGRDWYHDSGEAILFHANDDPARANLVAGDVAITSPATSVSANTGFGVKGYNQAVAGVPVEAGRFPTAMGKRIEELHEGGEESLGLKRDPFAGNIARGGGFLEKEQPPRAVHDIWDAEAHGYVNEDGTPMRQGFGPAQHRFMDTQQDKIIATANKRELGGFNDWEELRSQAGAWTGQKVDAGGLDPNEAAKSIADHLPELYAQGHREFAPGATTGHMPELLDPNTPFGAELRREWADRVLQQSGIYDAQMRDQITAAFEGLVGRSFEGPGYFKGQTSPGVHTQTLTGSVDTPEGLPGARGLDKGSKQIMDAAEAVHSILLAQDAGAYTRVLPAGSGAARTGWDVTLPGGTLTDQQMLALMADKLKGSGLIPIPTPGGVRLIYGGSSYSDPSRQQVFKFLQEDPTVKGVLKAFGGTLAQPAGAPRGSYFENDWQQQRVGQDFAEFVRNRARGPELFDKGIPPLADNIRKLQAEFVKDTRGRVTANPLQDEIRGTIANEGWSGLERLAKKYAGDGKLVSLAQKYQVSLFTLLVMLAGLGSGSTAPGQERQPQWR